MDFLTYLPEVAQTPMVERVVVLSVYALLAKATDLFVNRILKRVVAKLTVTELDDKIVDIVHGPIVLSVFLAGVIHAAAIAPALGPPLERFVPAATKSIALMAWTVAALRVFITFVEDRLHGIHERGKVGTDLLLLLKNVVRVVIIISSLLWMLSIWNVDLTPLFASAGIAGIAVALAAKDTLANFFGGISIFADRTFKVGDYIIIDDVQRGEVVEIGVRSTRIMTRDDVLITIPNSVLAGSKIVNESAPLPRFRIRVAIGVAYGSDIDEVEAILLDVTSKNAFVVAEPEPRVRMRAFGPSSLDMELLCWVEDPALKGRVTHDLLKATHKAFKARGVTIPFPQQDVYIKQLPERVEDP